MEAKIDLGITCYIMYRSTSRCVLYCSDVLTRRMGGSRILEWEAGKVGA